MNGSSTGSAVYSRPRPSHAGQTASSMVVRGTSRSETASDKSVGLGAAGPRTEHRSDPLSSPSSATLEAAALVAAAVQEPRIAELPPRSVAVVEHAGPVERIDDTRRPLYRHMVQNELVGGPSILRWLDPPQGERVVDALVVTHAGFDGDEVCRVETLPGGRHAILDYEGDPAGLPKARGHLAA